MATSEFHQKGWYFTRLPSGSVRIRVERDGSGRDVVHIIPPLEWASIVGHVSPGDDGENFAKARELHGV